MDYNPGDSYPKLGRKIVEVIDKGGGHLVFIDEDLNFQYDVAHEPRKENGPIINRITHLEALMAFTSLKDKERIKGIKRLLGEAFVRSYQGGDNKSASQALDDAEKSIQRWNQDISAKWYFCSALAATLFFVLLLLLARLPVFKNDSVQLILTVAFLGSIGAFASVCLRHRQLALDANMGLTIHVIEASARIFIGVTASAVMILLSKGDLILSAVGKTSAANDIYYALGILCGASERILPSFIDRAEKLVGETTVHTKEEQINKVKSSSFHS